MTGLLTADDVAASLGVSRDWVYSEVRAGRIPHVRLGRHVRFRCEAIEQWIVGLEHATMPGPTERRGAAVTAPGMAAGGKS